MGKRVGVQDLIKAGIIKPRFPIHLNFGGRKFSAEIDGASFVLLDGKRRTLTVSDGRTGPGHAAVGQAERQSDPSPGQRMDIPALLGRHGAKTPDGHLAEAL